MIKAIIFDVDNVLVDMDRTHFAAFNQALREVRGFAVSWELHGELLKGLPTTKKLDALAPKYHFSDSELRRINELKQNYTLERMVLEPDADLMAMCATLQKRGYVLMACSNAIRTTTQEMLSRSGVLPYLAGFLSAEDVERPKPAPDIYRLAFNRLGIDASEALIVEDSEVGRTAALSSGAHLCAVNDMEDVTLERIEKTINAIGTIRVVIPMAGAGQRFIDKGHTFPKPLIEVNGKPLIQMVVENLAVDGQHVFICQEEHLDKYNVSALLEQLSPGCFVEALSGLTEGALCSVLAAKDYFSGSEELIIANSDQLVEGRSVTAFIEAMRGRKADGGIMTFTNSHPKWSYAAADSDGRVTRVAEKQPISNNATVGIYYYKSGLEFIKYARQMIEKDIRVNGEFYVCPVFNEYIADGKDIYIDSVPKMIGLGTPEDLEAYLK